MRKTKSRRSTSKRTRAGAISGCRLSFNALEPRNLLAAVAPLSFGLDNLALVPEASATEMHCGITKENQCQDESDDGSSPQNFSSMVASDLPPPVFESGVSTLSQISVSVEMECEVTEEISCRADQYGGLSTLDLNPASEPDNEDGDSRPPSGPSLFQRNDEPSVNRPVEESPKGSGSPNAPDYPLQVRESVPSERIRSTPAPAETSISQDHPSLRPISILPATEARTAVATDVFLSEVDDANYFLSAHNQKTQTSIFRSGLTSSHQMFSVIAVNPALKSTTHAHNDQPESRVAENTSTTTTQQTDVDNGKDHSQSSFLNQQLSAEAAGSVLRTITQAAAMQWRHKVDGHVETSPPVQQIVAPILPSSARMPKNLINEDRPVIESKDDTLVRNLESTMILAIFHCKTQRSQRLRQSDRDLAGPQ